MAGPLSLLQGYVQDEGMCGDGYVQSNGYPPPQIWDQSGMGKLTSIPHLLLTPSGGHLTYCRQADGTHPTFFLLIATGNQGNRMKTRLILLLDGNPFDCDFRLCWIKKGQEEGWIEFLTDDWEPDCVNYPDEAWTDVDLDCEVEDEVEDHDCAAAADEPGPKCDW